MVTEEERKQFWINALIIIAVVALGLLAVNQALGFVYKSEFLRSPCSLCARLNPNTTQCLTPKTPDYPTNEGYIYKQKWSNISFNLLP